jgi:hypothetical protein
VIRFAAQPVSVWSVWSRVRAGSSATEFAVNSRGDFGHGSGHQQFVEAE